MLEMMMVIKTNPLLPKMKWNKAISGGSMAVAGMLQLLLTATLIHVASGKVTVQITNLIGYNNVMTIECRSLDDDLGQHILSYGQSIGWKFKPNFSKTTLFYCNARWKADVMLHVDFHAYEYMRDHYGCGSDCRWLFTINGVYAYDSKQDSWDFRFSWYS
ncbi:putative plant self-incompatibility S1 [Helianthus annuus]|uniref:S-protein homolog n=2 Tax=Helianthus annuus TaxID=4232 RepID=A0A9K3DUG3_HELAN|nr:putative plant self-incompatibility S1 [Helianthus annuus]KAJ0443825.1 putative plant self-incompatibility S1 [Helianthus annuus]KAJ0461244.1 putative plant self-incompatibility S1 [Helianthus annuus]KAJ0641669.1 putative plant self-incompatibility S1 [Helianthus annuus]KAJ0645551.1 putative plant self-incompatibility S1 [Helianthus annuus]